MIEPVSTDNLCKTGISPVRAGDFRRFRPQDWEIGSLETKSNARKAGISGPIRRRLQTVAKRRTGWLGREGSNLRMAESKSDQFTSKINEPSEFSSFVHSLRGLANLPRSECGPPTGGVHQWSRKPWERNAASAVAAPT